MTKYLRGTVEESAELLIGEVLDSAQDATFINILGLPKEPPVEQTINKTQLGKVLKAVAEAIEQKLSIVKTIVYVKNKEAIQLTHDDVRLMRKMIMEEYEKRFKAPVGE